MKLIACISWFNESPSWLAGCVASAARVCDHVVAVDGRYALFPHKMSHSPPAEAEAIVEAAEGAGIPLTLHRPTEPFYGNEIEKRNLLFRLAMCHAEPMVDWLIVLDADTYIVEHSDTIRYDLMHTERHSASYAAEEYLDAHNPEAPLPVLQMREFSNTWRTPITCIYRALPGLAYEGTHYSISGLVDGKRVWVWGHPDTLDPLDLTSSLVVRHRNVLRTAERREQAATYYQLREELKLEARPI